MWICLDTSIIDLTEKSHHNRALLIHYALSRRLRGVKCEEQGCGPKRSTSTHNLLRNHTPDQHHTSERTCF